MLKVKGYQRLLRQDPCTEERLLRGAPGEVVALIGANGAGKSTT